jgi:dipicolinate synthase subunit A
MKFNKFLVIGGDLRSLYLYDLLKKEGNKVHISGFSEYKNDQKPFIQNIAHLKSAAENVEMVIGPIPCTSAGIHLNAPFNAQYIQISDLFDHMTAGQIFAAGHISPEVTAMAAAKGIQAVDLLEREEMAILNAIPTAEGAVQLAMENMKITLHESSALVLGFGRVGKMLAKTLLALGAVVYVAVRKHSDASLARGYGYRALSYDSLPEHLLKMDVIFNTVPSTVLDKTNMRDIREECVIIELASKPFGIDMEESKKEGLNIIWAPSLPGKLSPISAANYIKTTIANIMNEHFA